MSFDEFLSRRLAELIRFACVLCGGDTERAHELVVDVLVRAFPHWSFVHGAGRPFTVLRTAVTRVRLESAEGSDAPARRLAAAALAVYSGQTAAEAASVLGVAVESVEADLIDARSLFDAADDDGRSVSIAERLDAIADAAEVDVVGTAATILDRLESEPFDPAGQLDARSFARLITVTAVGDAAADADDEPVTEQPAQSFATMPADAVLISGAAAAAAADEPADPAARPAPTGGPLRRLATAAAIVVLAVAVCALVAGRRPAADSTAAPAPSTTSASVPSPTASGTASAQLSTPIPRSLPGTKVLGQFYGSGPRTVDLPTVQLAAGRELALNAVCSGPGGASVGPVRVQTCDGRSVGADLSVDDARSLRIEADGTTTWRFAVVDEPEHGTNGSLRYPVNPLLSSAPALSLVGSGSGTGAGTVSLSAAATSARAETLRLLLTCTGSGVSFTSTDGAFDGQYTRTCFAGWSYEFDVSGAVVPGRLRVQASGGTAWQVAVVRA